MGNNGKPYVVVTTKHRGVFFGCLESRNGTEVKLSDARVCVYWPKETRGFVGLAAHGPTTGAKISAACPSMEVLDVTAILHCSPAASAAWEEGKWS